MFVGVEGARGEKVNTTTMVGSTLTYDTHLSTVHVECVLRNRTHVAPCGTHK
jgi:hypothetical protein